MYKNKWKGKPQANIIHLWGTGGDVRVWSRLAKLPVNWKSMRSAQEERGIVLHHCHPHLCQMAQSYLYDTKQNEQIRHQYVNGFQNRHLCESWHDYRHKEKHFSFKGHCGSGFLDLCGKDVVATSIHFHLGLRLSLHKSVVYVNRKSRRISLVDFNIDIDTSL